MQKEWKHICKDCGKAFGYSDISVQKEARKGMSKPERCQQCKFTHSQAIQSLASSHFALKPRTGLPSILGDDYLGYVDHGPRSAATPDYVEPDMSGVDIGLNERNVLEVYEALGKNQVVIVMAPTGSGKSTYIPSKLLYPLSPKETNHFTRSGPIIITQPRIAATLQIPESIGKKFGGCSVGAGYDVGYCYSKDKENYDLRRNRMVITTDGSLINWIADGMIGDFSMIIIDEAHERSYNIETIINMVNRELLKYPGLKVMIISATIDAGSFRDYFGKTTTVAVLNFDKSEKTYGYEEAPWKWKELDEKKDFDENIYEVNKREGEIFLDRYRSNIAVRLARKVIEIARGTKDGGILAFLDGKENINRAVDMIRHELREVTGLKVFPFHGELSESDNNAVINFDFKCRRILIATNSAETSLTLTDIVYVVDSGLIKEELWNSSTCRKGLETKFHSKAGCKQRWGRAGRVRKGFVEKMYSREEFIRFFPNFTTPAVQRSNAEPFLLASIASGECNLEDLEMLTRPREEELKRALSVIRDRGLIDKDGDYTKDGLEIYELSKAVGYILGDSKAEYNSTERSLDVACLLLLADKHACLVEAATVIGMMPHMGNSIYWQLDGLFQWNRQQSLVKRDYRYRLQESLRAGCIDDLDYACKLFSLYEGCLFEEDLPRGYRDYIFKEYGLNEKSFTEIEKVRNELIDRFCSGKKTIEFRKLNIGLVDRLRVLVSIAWNNKAVTLKKRDDLLFENVRNKSVGVISENCAGDWEKEKRAIIGIFDQNEVYATVDEETNKRERVPVANFLIKYVPPPQKPGFFSTITTIKKQQEGLTVGERLSRLKTDLKLPVNRKIKLDSFKKPRKIISSFPVQASNGLADDEQDFFISLSFTETGKENDLETDLKIDKTIQEGTELIITRWVNVQNDPAAMIDPAPIPYPGSFDNLAPGTKVDATILRPVYNIRGMGKREISGYMASINGYHYGLPVESIFIDFEDQLLAGMVGQRIELWMSGIAPKSGQPVFSRMARVEKEREGLFKRRELKGKILRKSQMGILCEIVEDDIQFPHFVRIPVAMDDNDRRFLHNDGEVTLRLLEPDHQEPVYVDCVSDPLLDLDEEGKEGIRKLLRQLGADRKKYEAFRNCGIEIDGLRFYITRRPQYDKIQMLGFSYPQLSSALGLLHERAWEMTGEIQVIQKKVELDERARMKRIKIIQNIEKNEAIVANAKQKKRELLTKMAQPGNNSHWLSKAQGWLKDFDETIARHEGFAKEERERLINLRG